LLAAAAGGEFRKGAGRLLLFHGEAAGKGEAFRLHRSLQKFATADD